MERTNGLQSGLKKAAMVMFLAAALASTGCGQNALMNPTADQFVSDQEQDSSNVGAFQLDSSTSKGGQTSHPGGQISHP